jgi:hypothetical protein
MVLRARHILLFAVALSGIVSCWDAAWGQPRGPWGMGPPTRSEPIETGFLFVEGEYVPPPYEVRADDNVVLVNDIAVQTFPAGKPVERQVERPSDRPFERDPRFRRQGEFTSRSPARDAVQTLRSQLMGDQMVIRLPGQPEVAIDNAGARHEFLKELLGYEGQAQNVSFSASLPPSLDMAVWNRWVNSFEPSEDFVSRAGGIVQLYERTLAQNLAEIGATRRLNTFAYPLSVCGMVLTTIGMGHLLSQRPPVGSKPKETDATPLAIRAAIYSLGLVILFSGLDLAWTILASQAGQMRELNPLGSHLIENPLGLVAFKVGATLLAVGLLLALRKYKRAQLAAWWVCLICTLLTARWVLLNSMFVA